MNKILFIIWVILFIIGAVKRELFFIAKSKEKFNELKQAYIEYKKAKSDLYNYMRDNKLQK